jgi:DHA1 family bicyclomycin/chloramphenicol resistance-like MFS transporter
MDFFAPSLPDATRDLAASIDSVQSTIYIFLIGYGVSPFLWGVLADRLGRHSVMMGGLILYCLASIGCFLSSGIPQLSAMRLLQGVGAASGVVIARAVLRDIHGPRGATKAISGMFLIMVWVPISAPLLGGYLGSHFNWRVSFLIMAMIAGMTLLGSFLWQSETKPDHAMVRERKQSGWGWHAVLMNPVFVRHALANMFCVGTMLVFLSNYSYLTEQHYRLSSTENGFVLAIFNAGISAGVYLVRLLAPRLGVERTIYLGLWLALIGWVTVWGICLNNIPAPMFLLAPVLLACLGIGIVISLTVGQALVPFSYAAGVASALFVCLQSAGASLISFSTSLVTQATLTSISTAIVTCSLLAMASMQFISKRAVT